ncbi:hypothetical protein BIU88_05935 [Chlorobaculum limnaeum]|uniref:Uncharacterized protein n=1 Tax=Chlorobaculum limnaeum TaxID=274537 RepID=A0A1D8D6E6_CHLLM|nr:hypothetical protein [Chlorobaculum limnaeum]AOS83728.1 hypothetical protein BIU88_05935 [Chlorobaculum limnaeum]
MAKRSLLSSAHGTLSTTFRISGFELIGHFPARRVISVVHSSSGGCLRVESGRSPLNRSARLS